MCESVTQCQSLLTVQVRKLYSSATLEPIADVTEAEELDGRPTGEGELLKGKPGASGGQDLQSQASLESLSHRCRENSSGDSLHGPGSGRVGLHRGDAGPESAGEASSCESFPQSDGGSEENVELAVSEKGGEDGAGTMTEGCREDKPGMAGEFREGEADMAKASPEGELGFTQECVDDEDEDEDGPGVAQASLGEVPGVDLLEGIVSISQEIRDATGSHQSLLLFGLPSREDVQDKSGYEAIWECIDTSQDDRAQDASLSEASVSCAEDSGEVAEETEVTACASAAAREKSCQQTDEPDCAHTEAVSQSSLETRCSQTSSSSGSVSQHDLETDDKPASSSSGSGLETGGVPASSTSSSGSVSPSALEAGGRPASVSGGAERGEAAREAASCEAMQQCDGLLHDDQQRQLSSHCAHDPVGGEAEAEKWDKDSTLLSAAAAAAERNGTVPVIKQSADDLGNDVEVEVAPDFSSGIKNIANSHKC